MSYCDDCIHVDLCADEACEDEALTFCADKIVLVRCKDCKWGMKGYGWNKTEIYDCERGYNRVADADWFCADGERRTDERQTD